MIFATSTGPVSVLFPYCSNQVEAEKTVSATLALDQKAVAIPLNTAGISGFDDFFRQASVSLKTTFAQTASISSLTRRQLCRTLGRDNQSAIR